MTYQFPETLSALRTALVELGMDVNAFKTERQAAYLIQHALDTRIKLPPKGQSCFPVLQKLQEAVTVRSDSEEWRSRPERLSGEIPGKRERGRVPLAKSPMNRAVPPGLVLYCDGACEPNPGAGGWGYVVYRDGVEIHSDCGGSDPTTNNIMELTGALRALEWIAGRSVVVPVRLFCDSQYVVKGCNDWRHGWKAKGWKRGGPKAKPENSAIANLDLWKELDEALTAVPITLEWVKGHAGVIGNERADELSLMGREGVLALQPDPLDLIREQLDYGARGEI